MIIYNITNKIDLQIADEWLGWIKEEHIPDVMNSGCFIKAHVYKLLDVDDSDGLTYIVQFEAESKSAYNLYIENHAAAMRQKSLARWADKTVSFRSVMQVVH